MRIPIGIIVCWICCSIHAQQYHGTLLYTWNNNNSMNIYLPQDYFSSEEYYPVLYLLHGVSDNELCWLREVNVRLMFDELISKGEMREMIIIMPSVSGLVNGSYESSFDTIMSYVESTFRIYKNKEFHAIAGISLGGFYAMHISHRCYNHFDYVGLFSAIYTTDKKSIFKKEREALFGITQTSPIIYKNTEKELEKLFQCNPKLYFISIGKHDFLYNQNVLFRNYLTENKYPFVYHETGGGHDWKNWQTYLMIFLPLLFNDLPDTINTQYKDLEDDKALEDIII